MIEHYLLFLLLPVISLSWLYNTTQPTWLTSPYFRAGNQAVISTLTGNTSTPTYTFTFSSSLSGIPNLAYGIKNYRGNDTLLNQCFQIRRKTLSSSNFKVSIQIFGFTNLWILAVPYIAIDPAFPHHLNSFDNVELNYSSGPLTNFSAKHATQYYHTEYINYTSQASACTYKTFQLPLTSNKIVLFMTSLYIFGSGTSGGGSSSKYPLNLTLTYQIVNTSHYYWTAYFGIQATITSLHFSQLIFNQQDVEKSNKYVIIYELWVVNASLQWQAFPQQLIDNMIIGLQDFQTIDGACGFQYQWQYANSSSVFGVQHLASIPKVAYCGFSVARSSVFYIKTWQCDVPYIYFNLTNSLCQDACADYYYNNVTAKACDTCYYSCQSCSLPNSQSNCSVCETSLNRVLINGKCQCSSGYYDDGYEVTCRTCSVVISHCATCTYSLNSSQPTSYYQSVFSSATWSTDILPNFTCLTCDSQYFLNSSGYCILCTLNYCLTCINSTACQTCNSSANATLTSTKICVICDVNNCATCSSDNFCSVCDTNYNVFNGSCLLCNESCTCDGWVLPMVNGTCSTLCGDGITQGSQQCDDGNTNSSDGCSSTCQIQICNVTYCTACSSNDFCSNCTSPYNVINGSCYLCNQSCTCDGWVLPIVSGVCSTLCGDGILQGSQQCDDNNTINNDGCSSTCKLQYCGNGIIQNSQQCDNGADNGNGQCTVNCTKQVVIQAQSMLIPAMYSQYAGYGFFMLGFKIAGMQMLAVIQNFQLILKSVNDKNFQIDFSTHGYINQESFFFKIKSATHLLMYFNYMFVAILGVFIIGILLELISFCSSKNQRKIANSHANLNQRNEKKKDTFHSQISSQNSSEISDNFVVHCQRKQKTIKQLQTQENLSKLSNDSTFQEQPKNQNCLYRLANIILKQIFLNLIINELYIFTYGISLQFNTTQFQYFLNLPTILIFCLYFLGFVAIFWYLKSADSGFGQNQLKLKKGFWLHYWLVVTAERLIMGAILGGQYNNYGLWGVLAVKIIFVIYHIFMRFFQQNSQLKRSLATHLLHLLLIIVYIFNVKYFQTSSLKDQLPSHIIEYIEIAILVIVVIIAVGYLIKQVFYNCEADYRNNQQKEESQVSKCQKLDQVPQDSSNSFNLSQQYLKKPKISAALQADMDLINNNMPQIKLKQKENFEKREPTIKKTFRRQKRQVGNYQKSLNVFQSNKMQTQLNQFDQNYKPSNANISLQNYMNQRQSPSPSPKLRPQEQVMNDEYKQYLNRNNNSRHRRRGYGVNNNQGKNQNLFNNSPIKRQKPLGERINRLQGQNGKQKMSYLSHGLIKNERPNKLSNMYANHFKNRNSKKSQMNIINTNRSDELQSQFDDKVSIGYNMK